jgi:ELWxxDGT repeat protein
MPLRHAVLLCGTLGISAAASLAAPAVHLVADINQTVAAGAAANGDSNPNEFVEFNGRMVFAADDGVHGRELWKTDGTAAGTQMLVDIVPGLHQGSNPTHLFVANGALYFFVTDLQGQYHFMRLSADESSLAVLADIEPSACTAPVFLDDKVFFTGGAGVIRNGTTGFEQGVWTTDGTADGTYRIELFTGVSTNSCGLVAFNNKLAWFSGGDIWTSDGTREGTHLFVQGSAAADPVDSAFVSNGVIYYHGGSFIQGLGGIFRSDGTAAGTLQLFAFAEPGPFGSADVELFGVTNGLIMVFEGIYSINPSLSIVALSASDGTVGNVTRLQAYAGSEFVTSSKTYFAGSSADTGIEPWVTDGTAAGTHILRDIVPGGNSSITWFADYHGTTLISLSTPAGGQQLWQTDGTSDGTRLISNILPEPVIPNRNTATYFPAHGTANGDFYFVAQEPATGTELYAYTHDAPTAANDSGSSADGKAVTLSVLTNDTDSDSNLDTSSVKIETAPAHGTAKAETDGTVTYTPTAGYSGSDTFSYTVADSLGKRSNTATVTVTAAATTTPHPASSGGGALQWIDLVALLAGLGIFRINGWSKARD